MFILIFLLTVLAIAGVVATIRSSGRDGYGRQGVRAADDDDALIRWR
ncbi:hypothetical protein [Cryobacterium sp. TMS1-20-1]|nr:hypothetical protein [Cryobacterium sp. TMS1-20-1]